MKTQVRNSLFQVAILTLATLAIGSPLTAGAGAHSSAPAPKDIVDTAVSAGSFNTLAAALQAAGLIDALKGDGPFTVFAPTDDAFAKLPEGTVDNLLKPENIDQLKAVLTYHVVSGKIMSGDIGSEAQPATLQGSTIEVVASNGGVTVNGANVVSADVAASNGVIHVIDAVILPPSDS